MKKIISVLLTVVVLASAIFCTPAIFAAKNDKNINFVVGSDIHVAVAPEKAVLSEDGKFSNADSSVALADESKAIAQAFLQDAAKQKPDFVLISGDLTPNGSIEEFENLAPLFKAFEKETGIQLYVIPGNHDYYSAYDNMRELFREYFFEFGFKEAKVIDTKTNSYVVDLNSEYVLLAIDSNGIDQTGSEITDELIDWIKTQIKAANEAGKKVIAMQHHPIMEHYALHEVIFSNFIVENWRDYSTMLADLGVELVFTGHDHASDIASFTSAAGNTIYEVMTTALLSAPTSYRVISMSEGKVDVKSQMLKGIVDTKYLAKGYPKALINRLKTDLNGYARDYFAFGIEQLVHSYLEPDTLMELIGTDSAVLRFAVEKICTRAHEAVFMPLYGDNSLSSIAKSYNVTLPASDYETMFEMAMNVVLAHFEGDEKYYIDSPEVQLVLKCLNTALQYALEGIPDGIADIIIGKVLESFGVNVLELKFALRGFGAQVINTGDHSYEVVSAVLKPVLEGYIVDNGPADNNAVLSLRTTAPNAAGFESDAKAFFAKMYDFWYNFVLYTFDVFVAVI